MSALSYLSALLNSPSPVVLSTTEWDALLPELRAEQLTPFVYARLRASPAWREVPEPAQRILAEDFQSHSVRTYLMQAELAAIVEALRAVDVPVMLLKGAALGRMVYASPAERPIGDLDLLIPADRLDAARKTLIRRDYRPIEVLWMAPLQQRYRSELALVCQAADRQGLLVELHWSLFELPYYIERIPMADIWQTAKPAVDLPGAMLPDPSVLLVHSCAHWALHHGQVQRLLWLLDVDRLVRWDRLKWDPVLEQATGWHLQLALRTVVQQAETQLGTPVPGAVMDLMNQWQPAPAEAAMWGLGDEQPGRTWRRMRVTWGVLAGEQRWRYAAWLGLRVLLWPPKQFTKEVRWNKAHD